MYLHIGQDRMVPLGDLVGIFDLDNTSSSFRTRSFLRKAEAQGRVVQVWEDLPKSFVLCERDGVQTVYMTQMAAATLLRRAEAAERGLHLENE